MAILVLVVDDSSVVRHQLQSALVPAGFDVLQARDGKEGLDALTTNPAINMVLCDVNMPHMNGIEMTRRAHEAGIRVPILMVTGEYSTEMVTKARSAGAVGWVRKPYDIDGLIMAIKGLTK